jgi:hypothetical protein
MRRRGERSFIGDERYEMTEKKQSKVARAFFRMEAGAERR